MSVDRRRILVVEDDKTSREATRDYLAAEGFDVITARSGGEAVEHLTTGVAVIVTDLVMPGMDGLDLLRTAREDASHAPVIMMTGHGDERSAVTALKSGAFYYLAKPVNPDELVSLVRQAVDKHRMAAEIADLHRQLNEKYGINGIIGASEAMRRIFERIRMVADTRSTVLIEGESGTGKELVGRALHQCSTPAPAAVRRPQLRGPAGHSGRERAVRAREGCVHRRRGAPHRQVPGGRRGDPARGRDR
jgi:two-component system response regulator HydG